MLFPMVGMFKIDERMRNMVIVYDEMIQPLIANTVMYEGRNDGTLTVYKIKAADGYVLHDKRGDRPVCDKDGNETGKIKLRFRVGTAVVPACYDFDNIIEDTYNGFTKDIDIKKHGIYMFYAVPQSEVSESVVW